MVSIQDKIHFDECGASATSLQRALYRIPAASNTFMVGAIASKAPDEPWCEGVPE
jgi:hypothetical protein